MPGVGSFGDSMDSMIKTGAKDAVLEFIERERPFLGICLGLQLLSQRVKKVQMLKV